MAGASPEQPLARVALVGLGCRAGRADLEALAGALPEGTTLAASGGQAELVVVATCALTSDAERASRQAVRRALRDHPGARIVAAGCYAQRCPGALSELPGVAAVVGARAHRHLPRVLHRLARGEPVGAAAGPAEGEPAWDEGAGEHHGRTRPVLKVQDGCDQGCAYCAVPLARGPSRSMPFASALSRAGALRRLHAEVVLAGVHLGAYGRDLSPPHTLAELVLALSRSAGGRLRLSSIEPQEVPLQLWRDDEARAALCPHLHLPLQSGSSRVLEAMRRPYRPGEFARTVEAAAALLPGACLGADVLAGFPGESEADHRATVALVSSLPLAYLHVFPFSPRPGTRAARAAGAVPPAVRRERAAELRSVSDGLRAAFLGGLVGRTLEVVVERAEGDECRGTSREFASVRWPRGDERRGELTHVRVRGRDRVGCWGLAVP
ncbi:MAG TPA: MiaB/RimO family radical SAM methylthiotransferase [Anaeromyxobacter sp.]|nr:MiaB/RimO family radical SAM methylthiotransferase [Anaeromyxobacter sp.]